VNYDKLLGPLLKLCKEQSKGSAHKPKRPMQLLADTRDADSKDTQRFIQDVQIKLNYFKESLVDDMDKISNVIPLLHAGAKNVVPYHLLLDQ